MSKFGPYVDITQFGFLVEPRYFQSGWTKDNRILARESAAKALLKAQENLPAGYKFKVWDFQRTLEVQLLMIEDFRKKLMIQYPDMSEVEVQKAVDKFAAKPLPDAEVTRPDCHRNGGAVDLTIVGPDGKELDMGTDHDELSELSATMYFHRLQNPTEKQLKIKNNRQMLFDAMSRGGWDNYSIEWWHWSTTE